MPNRIIKESICTSENIDQLSSFQETFFYRLLVNCDDYGRMDARPKILASRLFPLKDIRSAQIEDALRALTSAELVILYEVDGKPFLQTKTWDRHQQVRAKKSKYPACEHMISDDIKSIQETAEESNGEQAISDDSKCTRNPIQSESESESESRTARTHEALFDRFWKAYPRHEAKKTAERAFAKLNPDETLLSDMLNAVKAWKETEQWREEGGKFIPYPATWINQRRWEDELPKQQGYGSAKTEREVTAQQYQQREYGEEGESLDELIARLQA